MDNKGVKKRIAILGGGPGGLFMYKRLVESGKLQVEIHIYERKSYLGKGMPYSTEGANDEHITNVSDNEIPTIFNSIADWVKSAPKDVLDHFNIDSEKFNEYKVLPRLFFGEYLSAQFELLKQQASKVGIKTVVHLESNVTDVLDAPVEKLVKIKAEGYDWEVFDHVIICTGHNWPAKQEGKIPGYYDSPYPPKKLVQQLNHPVAIKGSSLTAIDAIRTLSRSNGTFSESSDGKFHYKLHPTSPNFKLVMHSRNGLLPAVRFHLEDSHLGKSGLLSKKELAAHIKDNEGFISLDFVFEKNFKEQFIEKDPEFYYSIKDLDLESFVDKMLGMREHIDAFDLFKMEYEEAELSIERRESIYWKEMLAVLSFAMNYPAKYLSAEDMQRLQKVLMPLISIVIAFVPQSSCRDLMALHDAGVLSLLAVGDDSEVEALQDGGINYIYRDENDQKVNKYYETYVDCVGQPHLSFEDFPFRSLISEGAVIPAKLEFRDTKEAEEQLEAGNDRIKKGKSGKYFLRVSGITINDCFQIVNENAEGNDRVYIMAVPYIGGYNPDYSGIDFSEAASEVVMESILNSVGPLKEHLPGSKVAANPL